MQPPCEQCPKFRCCDAPCPVVNAYADQDYVPEREIVFSQIGGDTTLRDDDGIPYSLYDYVRPLAPPYELSRRDQDNLIRRVGTVNHLHEYDTQPDEDGHWNSSNSVWESSSSCNLDRNIIRLYYFKKMLRKDISNVLLCSPKKVYDVVSRNHYLVARFRRENKMPKWKPKKYAKVVGK